MLSITKISSAAHRTASGSAEGKGYLHYLGGPSQRERSEFDDYARGDKAEAGPTPFWACKGAALLGLDDIAEAEQVERLAKGFHPVTGAPLVLGAGDKHVMGLDMTFSAPKDFSAVFAGADASTREALIECLKESAKAALSYAEEAAITRHGKAGRIKQAAQAAIASCYTHFASRALDPQLHVHAFMFNAGKRRDSDEWSALELRPQFERKLATGILFRAELAHRLQGLGFGVVAAGPYFSIDGIDERQRDQLSTRSREIADYMRESGMSEADGAAEKRIAALKTRSTKSEPPLPELLKLFESKAAALGITPESVAAMRAGARAPAEPFGLDHGAILDELLATQSCATPQEALALICEKAMGRWSAAQCLAELDRFMAFEQVVSLGRTEQLTEVFTSKATKDLEASISAKVDAGAGQTKHRLDARAVDAEFDRMESELRGRLGVNVTLAQQRAAAMHIASETGAHAFVEGWAGTGKTTMLKALGAAYKTSGFSVLGCCQSAAASQNLSRETGIPSRTIASLMLSLREGRAHLHAKSIVVLDEAGMVGSREFADLQAQAIDAGAKLVCVGDPKQLQPIDAGGIFGSLMQKHGKAEISNIQRQRTDFEPLLKWLTGRGVGATGIAESKARALRELPEDARMSALEAICSRDEKLARAFAKWRARFDFEWMREAVELFARGDAGYALALLESKKRLKLVSGQAKTYDALITAWAKDKTPLANKAIVAATRAEVAALNAMARAILIDKGLVDGQGSIEVEIKRRDETTAMRSFGRGDRIVFTLNDRALGVANGVSGFVKSLAEESLDPILVIELDDANERGERVVRVPASFARFDHAYCLTNHKSQGRTFDSAHVLANPSMSDREWTYVAASRSRFATTLYVNAALLGLVDPESHREADSKPKRREEAIAALASRMRRSRAKGTTLDHDDAPDLGGAPPTSRPVSFWSGAAELVAKLRRGPSHTQALAH